VYDVRLYDYRINCSDMNSEEMKSRTKMLAINIARLTQKLPETVINRVYIGQIIRSASSVGANYRASRRAKSPADFINKFKNRRGRTR
jgi:four helix bundle protein